MKSMGSISFCHIARLFTLISVLALVPWPASSRAQNVLVFPQFVTGGDFISSATLMNTNFSTAVSGTKFFFNNDGTPKTVSLVGSAPNSQFPVNIPAGGTVVLTTTAGGPLSAGMAKFVSDFPAGGVVRFQNPSGQVGVLDSPSLSYATLPLNTSNGNDTGLAITNSGTVPVNLSLVYADETGTTVETKNPPELNPLPVNGQVPKFISQFGFTQTANKSKGSIQIRTNGAADQGRFNALALLLNGAQLSTTAIVPGAKAEISIEQFAGSSTGSWTNTTFGSTGGAFASMAGVVSTKVAFFKLTLTGSVFGGSNPPPTVLSGTFNNGAINLSGNSDLFGPVTMTIAADGTLTFTANSVPGPTIATFTMNGTAHPDKITGNYTVTFKAGGANAVGTIVLNHTNQ